MSDEEEDEAIEDFLLPENPDDVTPTTEPRLTQLDEASRSIILNGIYRYGYLRDVNSGGIIKKIDDVVYPELEKALAYAGSHLNSVMNYTWAQGQAALLYWEGLFYDPLSLYYDDDMKAIRILDAIDQMLRRAIIGGSMGGSHQSYNVQMAGSYRTMEMRREVGNK